MRRKLAVELEARIASMASAALAGLLGFGERGLSLFSLFFEAYSGDLKRAAAQNETTCFPYIFFSIPSEKPSGP